MDFSIKLLLVEDDQAQVALMREKLGAIPSINIEVWDTQRLNDALEHLEEKHCDIILLDLSLPDSQGLETFLRIQHYAYEIPIVVLTGLYDENTALSAVHNGAQDYLNKDQATVHVLERVIKYALERHRLIAEVRTLSLRDDLTGLYNHRGFSFLGHQQLKLAARAQKDLSLLYIDLDTLKQINDAHGHLEGDVALKHTAALLKDTFRESDIVARIGGDEFAVLSLYTSDESPEVLKKRLEEKFSAFNARNSAEKYSLTVSVGVAHFRHQSQQSISDLLSEADHRMYEEKRQKKFQSQKAV